MAIEVKRKNVASCCGAVGCGVCTVTMLLPVMIGTAGAATMASMGGVAKNSVASGGYWAVINAINSFGQPIFVASILLILYGMRHFGGRVLIIAAIGGILLYTSMYVLSMSFALLAISASILAVAYGIAYGPTIKKSLR